MIGTVTTRLLRFGLAFFLCLTMAGTALIGAVPALAQGDEAAQIPGFDALPPEAELFAWASGEFDGAGIATLLVERLAVEPGSDLGAVAGPFVLIVEQGSLVYDDDLGLEASIGAGNSQFFAPGEGDALANAGDEQAIVLRISLITDAPIAGEPGPEDGGDADDTSDDGSDDGDGESPENRPIRPRGGDEDDALAPAGVNALILQETTVPDEVVISLTADGFAPNDISIANGGDLVIENAGDVDCDLTIVDLDVSLELEAGDIEQITVDGPAGDYTVACTDTADNVLGEASMTVVDTNAEPEPDTTPDAVATPATDETDTGAMIGILLQTTISIDDSDALYGASLVIQPGGVLTLTGADGMLGLVVSGGDLTVTRQGRSPAALRDGRSVTLPSGTAAELINDGETPISLILAGATGSTNASDLPPAETPESDEPDDDEDTGNTGNSGDEVAGLYAFFPDDDAMAEMGLVPTWNAFTEVSDPGSNTFWMSDQDAAVEAFTDWGWLRSSELRYDSAGEETDFGQVNVFGILVDSFEDENGAEDFFTYIEGDPSGEATDMLDGIDAVDGAIVFDIGSGQTATMIVAIHSGSYVLTLFAAGPDLDVEELIRAVSGLIFGVVG